MRNVIRQNNPIVSQDGLCSRIVSTITIRYNFSVQTLTCTIHSPRAECSMVITENKRLTQATSYRFHRDLYDTTARTSSPCLGKVGASAGEQSAQDQEAPAPRDLRTFYMSPDNSISFLSTCFHKTRRLLLKNGKLVDISGCVCHIRFCCCKLSTCS